MAKISPTSIKYSIIADFTSEGPVDKPDVIGALFGQTEGLLGTDMELRELQKEGKLGRIEVNLETENGKTKGEIVIPSALDKTETTIIAASVETIDKIGPTDAKITIKDVEDVRGSKRDYIMERAKQLLGGIKGEGVHSREMGEQLRESQRTEKVTEYGPEKLAAGDLSGREVIVVEGRADVVNLLRYNVNNVIGMDGTKLPKTIAELGKTKELTLFVDGDRGGKLIAGNVCDNANVSYIAVAPDGKEVEELAGKEIHLALRKKVRPKEFFSKLDKKDIEEISKEDFSASEELRDLTQEDKKKMREFSDSIKGRNVLLLDENMEIIDNVPVSKLGYLKKKAFVLMVNNASSKVIEEAEKLGAKAVAAKTFGKIPETDLELVSI